MKRALLWMLPLILFIGFWKWRANHEDWRNRLRASPTLTLYSIEPQRGANAVSDSQIDGHHVLGQITLRGDDRDVVLAGVESAWKTDDLSHGAELLFSPRLAIETPDKRFRIFLSFSSGDAQVRFNSTLRHFLIHNRLDLQGKLAEAQLNALLHRAHVPIAPQR